MKSTCSRFALCLALACSFSILTAGPAAAQEKSVKPGINKSYETIKAEQAVKRFESESREIFANREKIVEACQLTPGLVVADVGAGTGLFTRLFAPKVAPGGKVYAVDITEQFVDHIKETCKEQKIDNVECILCTPESTNLKPESVDLVFVCDTYHHFEFPQKSLASIYQALRPGGRLIIVDYKKIEGVTHKRTMQHVRANQQQVSDEAAAAGFELIDAPDLMKTQYMLRLKKK